MDQTPEPFSAGKERKNDQKFPDRKEPAKKRETKECMVRAYFGLPGLSPVEEQKRKKRERVRTATKKTGIQVEQEKSNKERAREGG